MSTNTTILRRLFRTASLSPCNYRIGAVAFDEKGDVIGNYSNTFRPGDKFRGEQCRRGTSLHAEARLIRRYGKNIKVILIMRIGDHGSILPIDPCDSCKKMADKLGIKIVTVFGKKSTKKPKIQD